MEILKIYTYSILKVFFMKMLFISFINAIKIFQTIRDKPDLQ